MVNSRNKGATFEREVAKLLEAELGVSFKRDLEQYRAGDHGDLIPDDDAFPFVIECKRYAKGNGCQPRWWEQASRAATSVGKLPCVIYKYDREDIRCVVPFTAFSNVFGSDCECDYHMEINFEAFCYLAREMM